MKSFLALVVLIAFFASGEARKCYQCGSDAKNSTCGETFKKSDDLLKECAEGFHCKKEVLATEKNGTFVVRGCAKPEIDFLLSAPTKFHLTGIKEYGIHFCNDKDGCNGAGSFTATVATTMGLAMFVAKWN